MLKFDFFNINLFTLTMITLCAQDEIPEGLAKSFVIGERNIFALKKDNKIFAYENRCPHLNIELEWNENEFLDTEKRFIICSTHGALFKIEDGFCVSGPCEGQSLNPIKTIIENELILILD